jgi:hypothetical protein
MSRTAKMLSAPPALAGVLAVVSVTKKEELEPVTAPLVGL